MIRPFYLIIDSSKWLERLLPVGLNFVQLRLKNMPDDLIVKEIRKAKLLCNDYKCQLVINDYWQAAIDNDCDFVHLGQEDLLDADLNVLKTTGIKVGISTHSNIELRTALELKQTGINVSYIALGPIYKTTLKPMKWQPQGLTKLKQWKKRIGNDMPLVAIGGISLERAQRIFNAGADSIAVVSDIIYSANPEQRLKDWLLFSRSLLTD